MMPGFVSKPSLVFINNETVFLRSRKYVTWGKLAPVSETAVK
jgi:hypothetical protein